MSFVEALREAAKRNRSWVCVGLDPRLDRLPPPYREQPPAKGVEDFLAHVLEETQDLVCAVKPNAAFFEQLGPDGHRVLARVLEHVPADLPVILDAKRGDIGSTAEAYARWAFEAMDADAVTVHPYLGWDGVEPFARRSDRGVFVLVRTSNPSAGDVQDLPASWRGESMPVYEALARRIATWREDHPNVGAVAAATYPAELGTVRRILGEDAPLLVPGVGAQGGSAAEAMREGANDAGDLAIVTSSRGILYAEDPRAACRELRDVVMAARG